MDKETRGIDIVNKITFLDAKGNALTQSQAFQGFTNYFVTEAKLLKYVSKPTNISAGNKALNYVYESLVRPEMLEEHLMGEEVHQRARKGKRTYETIVQVREEFSTLPDEFDGLIEQFRGNGKFTISDTAMKSHAQEVAKKVDRKILQAHFKMKRSSGDYSNLTTIDVADLENITNDEANELANKILRRAQIVRNKETSQNVGREEAPAVAMVNPVIYTALAKSDFYRAYSPANSESVSRTGKIVGSQFGGVDLVEISQFDPINKDRYPEFSNVGVVISLDNVGGDAITEPAASKVAGATSVQTYNIRGILGFGPMRNEEDQRIEFIDVTEAGASNPETTVDVKAINGKEVKVEAYMLNGTTPQVNIFDAQGVAKSTAQDITTASREYTFTLTDAGEYYAGTTSGGKIIAESGKFFIDEE